MDKPWYTINCSTRKEFMKSYNLTYIHQLWWFMAHNLGLDFNPNHILNVKHSINNEITDWHGEE